MIISLFVKQLRGHNSLHFRLVKHLRKIIWIQLSRSLSGYVTPMSCHLFIYYDFFHENLGFHGWSASIAKFQSTGENAGLFVIFLNNNNVFSWSWRMLIIQTLTLSLKEIICLNHILVIHRKICFKMP